MSDTTMTIEEAKAVLRDHETMKQQRARVVWTHTKTDGTSEEVFDEELALSVLLYDGVVFLNCHWWEKEWPEEARKRTSLNVNCNDVFAWGCADAESMNFEDLRSVWDHHAKDPSWGTAVWCMKRRNQMPQKPVEDRIRKAGIWDIDAMKLAG